MSAEPQQFVTFLLAGEEHGVAVGSVREVLALGPITRVPTTPAWIRGVTNVRGQVLPVVDLALKLGLPATVESTRACIVVLESLAFGEPMALGVLVDEMRHVVELRPDELEPPPSFGTRVHVSYLVGMGRVDDRFVLLLDLEHALSAEELALARRTQAPSEEPS